MDTVNVTLQLPADLVKQAQNAGILTNDRIATLIQAELQRATSWRDLKQSVEPIRAAFREDYGHLSDDEVMDMINEVVHEVRSEKSTNRMIDVDSDT